MKITVLGFYGGYPYDGVGTSAYLIQEHGFNLLLDCGSGALLALEKVLDPLQLDAVLLSHYHADHIADVGVLQHYWQLRSGEKKETVLPIFGHDFNQVHFDRLNWPKSTEAKAYQPHEILNIGPLSISFQETHHPVTTFAIRIRSSFGSDLTFTADSSYINELIDFAKGTDLLITDTNYLIAPTDRPLWHMSAAQSAQLAEKSNCKQLLMSHLPQDINPQKMLEVAQNNLHNHDVIVKCATQNLVINI